MSCLSRLEIRSPNTRSYVNELSSCVLTSIKCSNGGIRELHYSSASPQMDTLGIGLENLVVLRNNAEKDFLAALKKRD